MLKKITIAVLSVIFMAAGLDYGKHYYVLHQLLKENPEVVCEDSGIELMQHGFRIHARGIETPWGECEQMRAKIPFFSFSHVALRADNLNFKGFKVGELRSRLTHENKNVIFDFLELRHCIYDWSGQELTAHAISLRGMVGEQAAVFTVFANKIKQQEMDLFNFSVAVNVTHPCQEEGRGQIKLRVSQVRRLVDLLTQQKVINGMYASVLNATFGDNMSIPFDVKGRNIYLGPIRVAELPELKKEEVATTPAVPDTAPAS